MLLSRIIPTLAVSLSVACQAELPPPRPFDAAQAFTYLEQQLDFGPRIPNSPGHQATAAWLDSLLSAKADTVVVQSWNHQAAGGETLPLRNFLARFNLGASERVLFLAHWDTRPRADAAASSDSTAPVPGANDGASGVAVLLGIADALVGSPPSIGVDLLFVDGEDYGEFPDTDVLLGSKYYADNLPPGPMPRWAILFDMVGDADLRLPKEGNSLIGAPGVVDDVWRMARRLGYGHIFVDASGQSITDDHVPLQQVGIPAINLIDFDYPQWHTPDDTIDRVSAASLQAVGDVAMGMIGLAESR